MNNVLTYLKGFVSLKRIAFSLFCSLLLSANTHVSASSYLLHPTQEMQNDLSKAINYLKTQHYQYLQINDNLSHKVLSNYLRSLDPNKVYFYGEDISQFQKYADQIDNHIESGNLNFGFDIYKTFKKRILERDSYLNQILQSNLDFNRKEVYELTRTHQNWPASEDEMNDIWRKRIKNQILTQQLTGTDQHIIYENIRRQQKNLTNIFTQRSSGDVFELILNAITKEAGPHTRYMSKATMENFKIKMSLSLEGIGVQLRNVNGYTIVRKVFSSGPAEKSGLLSVDDKIIGIGQSRHSISDISGLRLKDVVKKIRGRKGSTVYLKKLNGGDMSSTPEVIAIVRDVIKLKDKAAKLSYQKVNNRNFAVIKIPSFYSNKNPKQGVISTSRDVERLISKALATKKLNGLIIDLRGNSGGYLSEAVKLTGLFIDRGPIVQIKPPNYFPTTLEDYDDGVAYSGPLAVLVDKNSASASEIFAAAIQDYGRGLVIGKRTYGKGTVQRVRSINTDPASENRSVLKFTTQQFFRVNGESTQIKGVTPDIELAIGDQGDYGERQLENALPWSKIQSETYFKNSLIGIERLNQMHVQRANTSPAFRFLRANAAELQKSMALKSIPLNRGDREFWNTQRETKKLRFLNEYRRELNLNPVDKYSLKSLSAQVTGKVKHWDHVFQHESALILNDYLDINYSQGLVMSNEQQHNKTQSFNLTY